MLRSTDIHTFTREKALADGICEMASELRLVDVIDLIAFIRLEQFANVGDIVNSSVELYFHSDSLRFGNGAEAILGWDTPPKVRLDMEFIHEKVKVYFRLQLERHHAAVEIDYISFTDPEPDPADNTATLIAAIAEARHLPTGKQSETAVA